MAGVREEEGESPLFKKIGTPGGEEPPGVAQAPNVFECRLSGRRPGSRHRLGAGMPRRTLSRHDAGPGQSRNRESRRFGSSRDARHRDREGEDSRSV